MSDAKAPANVEVLRGFPLVRSPQGSPPITPEMVRRALDED